MARGVLGIGPSVILQGDLLRCFEGGYTRLEELFGILGPESRMKNEHRRLLCLRYDLHHRVRWGSTGVHTGFVQGFGPAFRKTRCLLLASLGRVLGVGLPLRSSRKAFSKSRRLDLLNRIMRFHRGS